MPDDVTPDMPALFRQLGLEAATADIDAFVNRHGPLATGVELADAPFWSDAQAAFLQEALASDGAWAIVVDELDARLRVS